MRAIFIILAVIAIIALVGCAGPVKEPEVRIVRVEVPVPVPCKTEPVAVPAFAADSLKKSDSIEVKVRALLAERLQRIGYERELKAAIIACQ